MLIRMPLAPSTPPSSSSGELIACLAASFAASLPLAVAVPIIAKPMPLMMALMSEKSRLIRPGVVIMSEIPCTPCRSTSSAIRNASKKLVPRGTSSSSRLFGIEITVSTAAAKSAKPFSADFIRRGPSKSNGLVTTATVSAFISRAREATTGAAPVPVPPPRPAVTKTISAPSSISMMASVSSSAAWRPTAGSAPAPKPCVIFVPICTLFATGDASSACRSVFTT